MSKELHTTNLVSRKEKKNRDSFVKLYKKSPIPDSEIMSNLGLFLRRQDVSKMLFLDSLYKMSLDVHGSIFEFGTRWGKNLSTLMSLRGIYEPYNSTRKIVGFDSFSGFPKIDKNDGSHSSMYSGNFTVTKNYSGYLKAVLDYQASESTLEHIRRHEVIEGDVEMTLPHYLKSNPETIISFAYFDLDIYSPTIYCLKSIAPYFTKGTVLGFDELGVHAMPGETIALRDALGLPNVRIQRSMYSSAQAFIVIE